MAFEMLVIGCSQGGLQALQTIFGGLPPSFCLPIVVVQHRAKTTDELLPAVIRRSTALPLSEAEDKMPITPGQIYLAPADYHLLVEDGTLALSTEAPHVFSRPSIDLVFDSASRAYKERLIGVVLTGASNDGARGAATIEERGGLVVVQDPASAEASAMPEAAIACTKDPQILPLTAIAPFLVHASKAEG